MTIKTNFKKILVLAWSAGWFIYTVMTIENGFGGLLENWPMLIPALIFTAAALLAFFRARLGGFILLFLGIFLTAGYPLLMAGFKSVLFLAGAIILLGFPPLISGILFLVQSE